MWFETPEANTPRRRHCVDPGGCFFRLKSRSENGARSAFERTTSILRARPGFEPKGVADVSASAFRARFSRPFGVHLKVMVAVEAEMRGVDAFDRLGGNLGVIRADLAPRSGLTLKGSVSIDGVRVAVVPDLDAVVAGNALEDHGLGHAGGLRRGRRFRHPKRERMPIEGPSRSHEIHALRIRRAEGRGCSGVTPAGRYRSVGEPSRPTIGPSSPVRSQVSSPKA